MKQFFSFLVRHQARVCHLKKIYHTGGSQYVFVSGLKKEKVSFLRCCFFFMNSCSISIDVCTILKLKGGTWSVALHSTVTQLFGQMSCCLQTSFGNTGKHLPRKVRDSCVSHHCCLPIIWISAIFHFEESQSAPEHRRATVPHLSMLAGTPLCPDGKRWKSNWEYRVVRVRCMVAWPGADRQSVVMKRPFSQLACVL